MTFRLFEMLNSEISGREGMLFSLDQKKLKVQPCAFQTAFSCI